MPVWYVPIRAHDGTVSCMEHAAGKLPQRIILRPDRSNAECPVTKRAWQGRPRPGNVHAVRRPTSVQSVHDEPFVGDDRTKRGEDAHEQAAARPRRGVWSKEAGGRVL